MTLVRRLWISCARKEKAEHAKRRGKGGQVSCICREKSGGVSEMGESATNEVPRSTKRGIYIAVS